MRMTVSLTPGLCPLVSGCGGADDLRSPHRDDVHSVPGDWFLVIDDTLIPCHGRKGRSRLSGEHLPTPYQMFQQSGLQNLFAGRACHIRVATQVCRFVKAPGSKRTLSPHQEDLSPRQNFHPSSEC